MKQVLSTLLILAVGIWLTLPVLHASTSPKNPFGVALKQGDDAASDQILKAKRMQAAYLRPYDVILDDWSHGRGKCTECERVKSLGMKLVLTIRNSGHGGEGRARAASTPPKDIYEYRKGLAEIILAYSPELIAVENEEDSAQSYFDGVKRGVWDSAEDGRGIVEKYADELGAACDVAHKLGARCTNGGMTSNAAALLTWGNYIKLGRNAEACDFAKRAFYSRWNSDEGEKMCKVNSLDTIPPEPRKEIAQYKRLIDVYKKTKLDYVNFHWHIHDAKVLNEVVQYLRVATTKPVITNEIGLASWDLVSGNVQAILESAEKLGLPYIVWEGGELPPTNFAVYRRKAFQAH